MEAQPVVFLSHSTGDPRDTQLARAIAREVRQRGGRCWLAADDIPLGRTWGPGLVKDVLGGCTHFVCVLSRSSLLSKTVREELGQARERQRSDRAFRVLRLTIGRINEPPEWQWIREIESVPSGTEAREQVEAVCRALHLGAPRRWSALVGDKTADFVGREFVFSEIASHVSGTNSGYFVVEGEPGVGKSTILAEYVRRTGCIAYFNSRSQGICRADQFLRDICAQLILRYNLSYPPPSGDELGDGAYLERVLEAAARAAAGTGIVIAVDALDEVDQGTNAVGANVLFLPPSLPAGVHFVMTQRPTEPLIRADVDLGVLRLADHRAEVMEDARAYLRRAASRPPLAAWLSDHCIPPDTFVEAIAASSQGNFMYLRHVLPDIERGLYSDLDVTSLPKGLQAYYQDHWRRMGMDAKPPSRGKISIIYVLVELLQPAPTALIAEVVDQEPVVVQGTLDLWLQFLRQEEIEGETCYSVYHSSFRDFLHDKEIVRQSEVTIPEINALIAGKLGRSWAGSKVRRGLLHAPGFVACLEDDIHAAVQDLESQRHHLQGEGEESLRSRLVTYLRGRGYEVTAETDEGGHVDILVRSARPGLLWVGECKVHRAYEDLDEGMLQLHTRYASGRYPAVGFLIFCFNHNAALVATAWRTRLVERRLCGMVGDPADDPRHALTFTTRHLHAGSGLEVLTTHVIASLYWRPEDRSGRESRGE